MIELTNEGVRKSVVGFLEGAGLPIRDRLFRAMASWSEFALFGGFIREVHLFGRTADFRDIDVVVPGTSMNRFAKKVQAFAPEINRFGGAKFRSEGLLVDAWPLGFTWAFREGLLEPSYANLAKSTFLNVDAIVADLSRTGRVRIFDEGYLDGLRDRTLRINLRPNPVPFHSASKAIVFAARSGFQIDEGLTEYIAGLARQHRGATQIWGATSDQYGCGFIPRTQINKWLEQIVFSASKSMPCQLSVGKGDVVAEHTTVKRFRTDRKLLLQRLGHTGA